MGTQYYIAVAERTPELEKIWRSDRDKSMIEEAHPGSAFDFFYVVGSSLGTKPHPTFSVMVKKSILEQLSSDVALVADDFPAVVETIGGLREYLRKPDVNVHYEYP